MKTDKEAQTAQTAPDSLQIGSEKASMLSAASIGEQLLSDPLQGLDSPLAAERLQFVGRNELEEEKKTPFILKLLAQFKDFLIIILIVAAAISAFLGERVDAVIIMAVVLINAILGLIQESRAEQALAALKEMSALYARVIRDGKTLEVPAAELVPGDLVELAAGDVAPADIRLIESSNLRANESALTGESTPVEKDAGALFHEPAALGDRSNMVYSGMEITYGRGTGFVTATAASTEIGKIASRLQMIDTEMTPLQVNLNKLGKLLGIFCILISAVIFGVGLLQGGEPLALFMTAISLAVAAIPEGLPAVVTILLALGMNRMARENAIVKRLLAVETLGSVDTICTDKTGTLTQNKMTVTRIYAGEEVMPLPARPEEQEEIRIHPLVRLMLEIGVLCNDAVLTEDEEGQPLMIGDPTEGALLTAAEKKGIGVGNLRRSYPVSWQLPFDSERKMMSVGTLYQEGRPHSMTKGAPDSILDRCSHEMTGEGRIPLAPGRKEAILKQNSAFAHEALRVLAFAYKEHGDQSFEGAEEGMTFVGLMAMIDPPRPEVRDAIEVCRTAGIDVVMITGDHPETARAIADELHLRDPEDAVLTGRMLEAMSDDELYETAEHASVYARVSPEHKVRIVEALKKAGRIVSMTGDGVNDAPALKRADIGVAMGITGTEVAKGASDMILTDDNFGTIVSAVEEGRVIYANIRKVVSFLLSCNVGEILVIFLTTMLFGPAFAPLFPVQLLWLNLVTDSFPALALGRERAEEGIMQLPPRRKDERIVDRGMTWSIVLQAAAIFVTVFIAFNIGRYFYPDLMADDSLVTQFSFMPQKGAQPSWGAHTYAFVALIMSELFRVFSARSETQSVFHLGFFSNRTLNQAFGVSFLLTLAVVYIPFLDRYFKTIPLGLRDWGIILVLVVLPFIAGELNKVRARRRKSPQTT